MKINGAAWSAGTLALQCPGPEGAQFALTFRAGDYIIKREHKRRSLDANAYAWELIFLISRATMADKNKIYRDAIKAIDGNFELVIVASDSAETIKRAWECHGIGWQADVLGVQGGYATMALTYGSSLYDAKQMGALIDKLVEWCKTLGIETMPPDKLAALLGQWEEKKHA